MDQGRRRKTPTSTAHLFIKKKPKIAVESEVDDDMSASDSLVAIRAQERAGEKIQQTKVAVATPSSNNDQVSRIAAAHTKAAQAADDAAAAEQSEGTVERVADAARSQAAPLLAQTVPPAAADRVTSTVHERLAKIAPPNSGVAADVFSSKNGGVRPPLAMQDNYKLLHRQVQDATRASSGDTSATAGQLGMRIADVAAQLVRETNQSAQSGQLPRVMASTVSPLMDTFMRSLVQRSIKSAHMPPHLNDPQSEAMTRLRQSVRVSRRAHEEKMSRVPRPGEPACSMGQRCMGNSIMCQGGGATWVAFYYEDEWAKYHADIKAGLPARLPAQERQCLLCIQYDTHRFIMSLRNDNMEVAINTTPTTPVILQPHFNLVDVEGEYPSEYCWVPFSSPNPSSSSYYYYYSSDTSIGSL